MLALASGVATVSSTGPLFDPVAGTMALCEPDSRAFSESLLHLVRDPAARAEAAHRTAAYAGSGSVERLARILLDAEPAS
jgi:hypothetical protein